MPQRLFGALRFYTDEAEPLPEVLLRRFGGHFPGSTVAVWPGADGRGVVLSGDSISPIARPSWVTFMRNFTNYPHLSAAVVRRVAASVADLHFDRIYSNFGQPTVSDGKRTPPSAMQSGSPASTTIWRESEAHLGPAPR